MTLVEQIHTQVNVLPIAKQIEVLDFVVFLQQRTQAKPSVFATAQRRQRLKQAFETLAAMGTFADIADPVEWQRQIRQDRPLPGRGE